MNNPEWLIKTKFYRWAKPKYSNQSIIPYIIGGQVLEVHIYKFEGFLSWSLNLPSNLLPITTHLIVSNRLVCRGNK